MTRDTEVKERRRRFPPAALLGIAAIVVAAVAIAVALVGTGLFSAKAGEEVAVTVSSTDDVVTKTTVETSPELSPPSTPYTHTVGVPSRIVIPAIGVDATIVKVGLKSNGDMRPPPYGKAGWFSPGPAPGAPGPAVIVAHLDTKSRGDVFYHLDQLKPGDEVYIWNAAGDAAIFVVDDLEKVLKNYLPTERVWEQTDIPLIRLVTCGGKFDRDSGHYLSNVIVYGHLVR